MGEINTRYENKWLSANEVQLDNGSSYMYASEPWCDSNGVAVLIYRPENNDFMSGKREFLGRYEICPAHSLTPELCSVTGGMDKEGKDAFAIAVDEVSEEAGFSVKPTDLMYLGATNPSKASDKVVHLFSVDVYGLEQGKAIGDGTAGEEGSFTKWVSKKKAVFCKDPLVATMISRLEIMNENNIYQ